ncbi:MAG: PilZ domain-containing protein [Gammaproteobacteria bacterium]|nr:PilZ domain-containing protein [Gammaproteobacteria bacterium]
MMEYTEKRDFYRMALDCTAKFQINGSGEMDEAMVKDLSSGGILLWIKQQVEPGSQLSIQLQPGTDLTPPLHAKAEVMRCDPVEEEPDTFAAACSMVEILD